MISATNINQFYGDSHTLWDLDFNVGEGGCTCVLGRNGVGKTTLMDCLVGLNSVSSGDIHFNGELITKLSAAQRARLGIAYVPQGRQIFPLLSVEENIQTGLLHKKNRKRVPAHLYEMFPVLETMKNRRGGDLSGGQQQQLAIARALALEPSVLILDEPTEGIQPNIVEEIGTVIQRLHREHNITVVIVEQKLAFARRVGTHFVILERGRKVAGGAIDELSDEMVAQYLTV